MYPDLDPNFSVLVGDPKATCKSGKSKGINKKLIAIIVPVVIGGLLLIALLVVLAPRYDFHFFAFFLFLASSLRFHVSYCVSHFLSPISAFRLGFHSFLRIFEFSLALG